MFLITRKLSKKTSFKKLLSSTSILIFAGATMVAGSVTVNAQSSRPLSILPIPSQAIPNVGVQKEVNPRIAVKDKQTVSSIKPQAYAPANKPSFTNGPVFGVDPTKVTAISGSLKEGMNALSKKQTLKALSIRAGMRAGSIDRKILAWSIAMSGQKNVTSGEIAKISKDLAHWPGKKTMRKNAEKALAREKLSARQIVSAFGTTKPSSLTGAVELAYAHIQLGNKKTARSIIAPFWYTAKLSKSEEARILSKTGSVLSVADHRKRMHTLFYKDRVTSASRLSGRAEQSSLAKARAAVIRKEKNAGTLLSRVAPSSKKDPAYLFTRIEHARRTDQYKKAAGLLLTAPKNEAALINPHEWWVESRIVSRDLLDAGETRLAYKVAANHVAKKRTDKAEAEFHAGWYALRFRKDARTARKHFAKILKISSAPISQARAYYWLGRASTGSQAKKYYKASAVHAGTFYGQLSAQKVGVKKLKLTHPRPSSSERRKFANREFVKIIDRLEKIGYHRRASNFYYALADIINTPGEMALLSVRAEKQGNPSLALRLGKKAHWRGMKVDTLAWPIGAIPSSTRIGTTGKALAYAIARQESEFNKGAVSGANARGLLQLLPGTAKQMARATGLKYSYKRLTTDAGYNATLGAAYLSKQLDNFDNSYILTIAGYNAGPRRSREWVERYGDPRGKSIEFVVDWIERIPFTETRNYVQRVMENYTVYKTRIAGANLNLENDLMFGRR